jgi:predicted secreted Zn-dependent protease
VRTVALFAGLLVVLGVRAAAAQSPPPPIPAGHHVRYFEVSGRTVEELESSLAANALTGSHGLPFFGTMDWYVSWDFQLWKRRDECRIVYVSTSVRTRVTLPRWVDSDQAPDDVERWWSIFFETLKEHELAHVDNARAAERAVAAALSELEPAETCGAARRAGDRIATEVVYDYRARDLKFDRDTRHGRDQLEAALAELE